MKNKALNHKQIEKARALATHQERLDDQKERMWTFWPMLQAGQVRR